MFKTVQVNELEVVKANSIHETALHGKILVTKYVRADEVYIKFMDSGVTKRTTTQAVRAGRLTPKVQNKSALSGVGRIPAPKFVDDIQTVYVKYQASMKRTEELKQQLKNML